jgi:type I restriction enzyme S subunit
VNLPTIPTRWPLTRLRDVSVLVNGFPFEAEEFVKEPRAGRRLVRIRDLLSDEDVVYYRGLNGLHVRVKDGDLLVGMDGDFNAVWWTRGDALLNQRVCCLRARDPSILSPRFLFYLLPQYLRVINDLTYFTTVKHLASSDVLSLRLGLPQIEVQRSIADFLDRKTAAIDKLVAQKERLVALLAEKRQALITEAVTKGLHATTPMKDSGVDWIGTVPQHWDVSRVKHVARLESGHTPSRSVAEHWLDSNDIPWVSLNDTKALAEQTYISETAYSINELGLQNSSARLLPARVVVFTRDATIGKAAITTRPMAVSQHIIAWVCGGSVIPEYLLNVFYAMEPALDRFTFGATIKTIGMDDVRELVTPVPPLAEQEQIIARITSGCNQIGAALATVKRQIDRLREYRQALITAAVTGELDIARAEPPADRLLRAVAETA